MLPHPQRHRRPLLVVMLLFSPLALLFFVIPKTPPVASLTPPHIADAVLSSIPLISNPDNGRLLYSQLTCRSCHGDGGSGSYFGPPLTRFDERTRIRRGTLSSREFALRSILFPDESVAPSFTPTMPNVWSLSLSPQAIADIADYVLLLD